MKKRWRVLSSVKTPEKLLEKIVANRNVDDINKFLNPPHPLLYLKEFDPSFRKSIVDAKKLLLNSINAGKPIIIHGDYDADGICATAILYNCIKKELGYEKCYGFIPSRFSHGYGLSSGSIKESLESFSRGAKSLFITVDSGITSFEEVEYLKELGHQVIITDHHQKPKDVPPADVVVWNDLGVGASISWVLARALGSKDKGSVGLAALATVTDVQELLGFNRSVVKMGIDALSSSAPKGLRKLLDISGVYDDKELTTYEMGWVIGPRINASGRMKDATDSLRLLISDDNKELEELAFRLNKINVARQEKTAEMFALAGDVKKSSKKFILSSSDDYHEGIIGLVAGRLVRKFYLPSIVIALEEDVGKGSVRSISGVDIIKVLREFDSLFIDLGGHPMAAGFSIKKENIKKLEICLEEYFEKEFTDPEIFIPEIAIDLEIPLSFVNEKMVENIDKLKPFGIGNKEPVFLSKCVGLVNKKRVGKEKSHVSMKFNIENRYYSGIFFSAENDIDSISVGNKVDIVYSVRTSSYSGNPELILKDVLISV